MTELERYKLCVGCRIRRRGRSTFRILELKTQKKKRTLGGEISGKKIRPFDSTVGLMARTEIETRPHDLVGEGVGGGKGG